MAHPYPEMQGTSNPDFNAVQGEGGSPGGSKGGRKGGKYRRVLCHPVLLPDSCPSCTTTPVVRRKPTGRTGKRIEQAKATFGTTEPTPPLPPLPPLPRPSSSHESTPSPCAFSAAPPSIPNYSHPAPPPPPPQHPPELTVSRYDRDSLLGLSQLSGNLAAHLLDLFQHTPDAFFPLPILSRNRLCAQFDAVGRRLDCLPPHTEVLANVIMALTSRISSHPLIVGHGFAAPEYETLSSMPLLSPSMNLREFGRRRENMCAQFKDNAVRMIWERGISVVGGEENAATCHLMDVLEMRDGMKTSRPYGAAFTSAIRALAEDVDAHGTSQLSSGGIHWSPFLMQEAVAAESQGRASFFTANDQLTICGEAPSIDQPLLDSVEGIDIRDVMSLFYLPMQAFTHGVTNLARLASEKLIGTYARRFALNEFTLLTWLATHEKLQALLSLLLLRMNDQLSPAAVTAFNLTTAQEAERAFVLRACRYTLPIAWASTALPVYRDLESRVQVARMSTEEGGRRTAERLGALLAQVRRVTRRAASVVAQQLGDAPTLGHLTHLHFLRLEEWARFIDEIPCIEEGGEEVTRATKLADLEQCIAGLRRLEFSFSNRTDFLDSLQVHYQNLHLQALLSSLPPTSRPQQQQHTSAAATVSHYAPFHPLPFVSPFTEVGEELDPFGRYGEGEYGARDGWGPGSPGWGMSGAQGGQHVMRNWP